MVRRQNWRPGWLPETAFVVALGGSFAVWQSGVAGGVATRVLVDLAGRGFAGEFVFAGFGIVALSFLAGAKRRGLTLGTIALLLMTNASMFGPSNAGHYPTSAGGNEVSLVRIAKESPERSVPGRSLISLNIGQVLGEATLFLPFDDGLADGLDPFLRAYTDVDTEFGVWTKSLSITVLESPGLQSVGSLGEIQFFVLGSSDSYFWIQVDENSIVILSEDLLP